MVRDRRLTVLIAASYICNLGCGGRESPQPPTLTIHAAVPRLDVSNVRLTVACGGVEINQVAAHSDFTVDGTFAMNGPAPQPITLSVQVLGHRDGSRYIAISRTAATKVDKSGIASFQVALTAPQELGTYELEAVYGKQVLVSQKLSVSAD